MTDGKVTANGIDFGYLEEGEGPLVLLLHGFPDDAHTWSAQMSGLAAAGYRAVAPFMRGYPPTGSAPDGRYDAEVLGADIAGLVEALGGGGPAFVVGHDWGAVATFGAMALHPGAVERAAVIAVAHPTTFAAGALDPATAHYLFHFWLFQGGDIAAAALEANDLALVDYLWDHWSPGGHDDAVHVARVKRETLSAPGTAAEVIKYYPGLLNLPAQRPGVAERLLQPTTVPTLSLFGADDPALVPREAEEAQFSAGYRREDLPGGGHFVHRKQPDEVTRLLVEWFGEAEGGSAGGTGAGAGAGAGVGAA